MKRVVWHKPTLKVIQVFPEQVRREFGYLLYLLQQNKVLSMPHSRAMATLGLGCFDLRVKGQDGSYRMFYCLKLQDEILVFHVFMKKTQQTPVKELEKGRKNLRGMI